MTEEEKKAIEIVKEIWQFTDYSTDKIALKVVLDLLEKLQKENEELRHSYDIATTKTEELKKKLGLKQFDVNVVYNDYLEKLRKFKSNSIPKDKIREKLEKIEKEKEQYYAAGQHLMYMLLKNQLKSLLEEE